MKTLDEVIKALEICTSGYCSNRDGDCPYLIIDNDCDTRLRKLDALYHLNKYRMTLDDIVAKRKALEDEIARYQEAVKNCEEAENKYRKAEQDALKALDDWASRPVEENKKLVLTVANPPLTWEQLKQMEGKPVWLVNTSTEEAEWVLVGEWFDDDEMRICRMWRDDADYIIRELYGETWQAYRKERMDERS